jgi:NADH-quinone oxidoreductase subunit G
MDGIGSAIRVDTRGREVMRILPRVNEAVNEEWISDKTRHVWDGLKSQRLDRPYVRINGKLRPASWDEAFAAVAGAIKASGMGNKVGAIAGDLAAVEDMYALKALMTALGSGMTDVRPPMSGIDPSMPRSAYLFNPTIAGIEEADAILIVGSNPRKEAPVLNARIRKAWRAKGMPIAVIGDHADLTYAYDYLGDDISALADVAAGKGFGEKLKAAKKPLVIVGEGAVSHGYAWSKQIGRDVIALASKAATMGEIAEGWNGFALLHNAASRVGGIDIGFVPHNGGVCSADQVKAAGEGKLDVLFLLGADEYDTKAMGEAFVIYVGTHGDAGANRADVILPSAAYTEKSGTYVNTEGRVQLGQRAAYPPGEAREDWAILRAVSELAGKTLPFDTFAQLRAAMVADFPELGRDGLIDLKWAPPRLSAKAEGPIRYPIGDFFLTNAICRNSPTMRRCSEELVQGVEVQEAAE